MLNTAGIPDTLPDTQMEGGGKRCHKCGKEFRAPALLKRHLGRKTPCELITDTAGKDNACRYCGKEFASRPSMNRHVRQYCKVANSNEGMEKLMERTLQRQITELRAQNAEQSAKIDRLTELLEKQLALGQQVPAPPATNVTVRAGGAAQVNTGPVTNIEQQQINIRLWSGEDRVLIPAAMLRAAFTENPRLVEYCHLSDDEKVDAERAAPYVTEALVDLVKRAHTDPSARNVYLNPRRSDQVLVYDESWKVLPLVEAIGDLFDSVAGHIHRIIVTDSERRQLPFEVQAAAAWVPNLYEDDRGEFVKRARAPMSAHLTNTAPLGSS